MQVNPFAYVERHGVRSAHANEADHNHVVVDGLTSAGVELTAVTDHYSISDSVSLLQAARAAGLVALPGFEASTVEGVHFLVILGEDATTGDVERLIMSARSRT